MATVVKVWDDADNQDGKRPQDLTVTLMKNETVVVQTVTLDAVHNWTANGWKILRKMRTALRSVTAG